jgi:galactokinase
LEKSCSDAVLIKRARHVIGEIDRTTQAANALRKGDFVEVSNATPPAANLTEKFFYC